jgi:predicted oxidoreductase (fatty acid repression mutant protein)
LVIIFILRAEIFNSLSQVVTLLKKRESGKLWQQEQKKARNKIPEPTIAQYTLMDIFQ